ncbi:MAG TPA: hypothetical protein VJ302_16115 [Blastocatellia bacterium]|nr:hypothetical protein [Blastocatellia bacterium]
MNSQAVARIFLVITLIVTAHIIKPFSVRNVSYHLMSATKSFVYFLPDSTRSSLNQANQLVTTLGHSLLEDRPVHRKWSKGAAEPRVLADHEQTPDEKASIQAQQVARWTRPAVKPAVKVQVPRPQVVGDPEYMYIRPNPAADAAEGDNGSLISVPTKEIKEIKFARVFIEIPRTAAAPEPTPVSTPAPAPADESNFAAMPGAKALNLSRPVVLPLVKVNLSWPLNLDRPRQIKMERLWMRLYQVPVAPKKTECNPIDADAESKESKLIALIDKARKRSKQDLLKITKSISSMVELDGDKSDASSENDPAPEQANPLSCPTPQDVYPQIHQSEKFSMEP